MKKAAKELYNLSNEELEFDLIKAKITEDIISQKYSFVEFTEKDRFWPKLNIIFDIDHTLVFTVP